jgi:hypothetical protein
VIYCVVPEALVGVWLEPLQKHYVDDPNVEVIVDRRRGERRTAGSTGGGKRIVRDRRRGRIPGTFPSVAVNGG